MRKGRFEQWEKDLIKEMREDNKSYNNIGKVLKRSKDSIGVYCRNNRLSGYRAKSSSNPDKAYEYFLKRFNRQYGDRYLYIAGYTHSDNDVTIECKRCYRQLDRNVSSLRHGKPILCECELEESRFERETKRSLINAIVKIHNDIIYKKQKEISDERDKLIYEQRQRDLITVCEECGKTFKGSSLGMKYCSDVCYRRMSNRNREKTRMYKIINNGKIDKDITLTKLIKRDKGICHICKGKCNRKDYTSTEEGHFIVGRYYPSIDHVVPISKGGTHTWDNIKLAHHYCNTIKRDKEIYEEGTGQFKLIM